MGESNTLLNTIPGQIVRSIEERGVPYNIIVAGEGYSGKTSLVQHLFGTDLAGEPDSVFLNEVCDIVCTLNPLAEMIGTPCTMSDHTKNTSVRITATKACITEEGTKLHLTVYEVSGIGDSVHSDSDWVHIRNLVLNRYEEHHMEEENGIIAHDKRVHCCLYLCTPRYAPRDADIAAMKQIARITNLVPVISKADTITNDEYKSIKDAFFASFVEHKIELFDCIIVDECKKVVELSFAPLRYTTPGRMYPYSTTPTPSTDLFALRDLLVRLHAIDIIEMTEKYYEHYRTNKLVVEILTTEHTISDNFKRRLGLEDVKLKTLAKKLEDKQRMHQALLAESMQKISRDLV